MKRLFFWLLFICICIIAHMLKFLKIFMVVLSLYFVLHTITVFGVLGWAHQAIISSIKDLSRLIFCLIVACVYPKQTRQYLRHTKYLIAILVTMAGIGIAVTLNAHGYNVLALKNIIIWLKYGWYFMIIFLSAGLIGYIMATAPQRHNASMSKNEDWSIEASKHWSIEIWMKFIVRLSWFILLGWIVIQGSKILFPELWYALGFGELNVYRAGVAPPLYYLTKQDGVMRYSGLFSGPNNFAFWLIGMTPLLRYVAWTAKKRLMRWWARIGLLLFGLLNLWRVLLVWRVTEAIPSFAHNKRIKNNKFLVWLGMWLIIWLFGYITYLKRESTTEHFALGIDAIHKFLARPWWYGLGSSGPGIHWNGSLLPENYYLQLALDYGWLGPVCFFVFWRKATMLQCYSATMPEKKQWSSEALRQWDIGTWNRLFLIGFLGMLIAGWFLHVFEDSMVNYLFFVPRGVAFWNKLRIMEFWIMNSKRSNSMTAD